MQKVDLVTRRFRGIIDQVRRHRLDLIGCSETRTVSARSVLNAYIPVLLFSSTGVYALRPHNSCVASPARKPIGEA